MLEMHFAIFRKMTEKNIKLPKSNVLNSMINTLLEKSCLKKYIVHCTAHQCQRGSGQLRPISFLTCRF